MKKNVAKASGIAMAMAAAGLLNTAASTAVMAEEGATTDLAHCYNVNVCKGHNDCAGEKHSCAGQGECKGQGFVGMPTKACEDVGGEVRDEWRGEIAKADLVHCYNVNVCKGHNDCATAKHSCAGQGECKGQGFVATTEKSCEDIGGEVGA